MFNSQKRRDKLEKADASNMKISTELWREVDVTCHWQCMWTVAVIKGKQSVRIVSPATKTVKMAHGFTAQAAGLLWPSQVVGGLETPTVYCVYCDLGKKYGGNGGNCIIRSITTITWKRLRMTEHGAHMENSRDVQSFGIKTSGQVPLRRSRSRLEDNIKIQPQEKVWEGADWIVLA